MMEIFAVMIIVAAMGLLVYCGVDAARDRESTSK